MENHTQIHAFMGVETGRVNGDQAGEADESQIIRGLLIPFSHVTQHLPYCGWGNRRAWVAAAFNCVSSLSPGPP